MIGELHTHGGTDAPECTTCSSQRVVNGAVDTRELMTRIIALGDTLGVPPEGRVQWVRTVCALLAGLGDSRPCGGGREPSWCSVHGLPWGHQ